MSDQEVSKSGRVAGVRVRHPLPTFLSSHDRSWLAATTLTFRLVKDMNWPLPDPGNEKMGDIVSTQ
ncbi:MAG TPA: hypothetical protein VII61_04430 [Ktedonobacteraceae bacterium]|jgi:hypothetical protein